MAASFISTLPDDRCDDRSPALRGAVHHTLCNTARLLHRRLLPEPLLAGSAILDVLQHVTQHGPLPPLILPHPLHPLINLGAWEGVHRWRWHRKVIFKKVCCVKCDPKRAFTAAFDKLLRMNIPAETCVRIFYLILPAVLTLLQEKRINHLNKIFSLSFPLCCSISIN